MSIVWPEFRVMPVHCGSEPPAEAPGQVDETNGPAADDYDPVTSPSSRAVTLIGMAEDKVRAMLHTISPYV